MNDIYKKVNELSNNGYTYCRFPDVKFGDGVALVTVYYDPQYFDPAAHTDLPVLLEKICLLNGAIKVVFEKCEQNEFTVCEVVKSFAKRFPSIASAADGINATASSVVIPMHDGMKAIAAQDFLPRLDEYLKNRFLKPIEVEVDSVEFTPQKIEQPKQIKKNYTVRKITPLIGDIESREATSVAYVDGNYDGITVCGVLTMPTAMLSKGTGASRQKRYEKFLLYDGEYTQQCRYFPNGGTSLLDCDLRNSPVVVFGNSMFERGRTGETMLTVKSMAKAPDCIAPIMPVPPPDNYNVVMPSPYEEFVQTSLFGNDEKTPENLKGVFVAFDFETTGLSIRHDKPTELGAVKIVDGEITEIFHTLIDPKRPIPDEVVEKTGINDEMVKGKPTFEDVLPDFYKFTYGAALVGHNIAFDFPFLIKFGNKIGYCFGDRHTLDTLGMAPQALPGIETLSLDNVLGLLGIVNDNAHRALSDATATAKAFIAMSKILSKQSGYVK